MSKIEVSHGCAHLCEPYIPQVCRVAKVESQTRDVKSVRLQTLDGTRPFDALPGQLGMLSVPPFGDDYVKMAVKRVGFVTERIHELSEGDQVGLRGPYGNWFPYESCGGPSLFRTCRASLASLGVSPADIITTLEARMKCGVGKCGRCNIGGHFICLDGPVFIEEELAAISRDF